MSTIYRWRSGSPSFTVTVSNLASDNSGVSKVQISGPGVSSSAFTSDIVNHSSGGTAGASSYVGTITFNSLNTPITGSASGSTGSMDVSITGTTVTWNSGGTCSNNTPHTITVCEPATTLKLLANSSEGPLYVWSNVSSTIPLGRQFSGAGTPYCKDTGTVKFVSGNTSYVTIASNSYVTSTSATIVKDTTKAINQSYTVTISGASTSAATPTNTAAAAQALTDTVSVVIKNAAKGVSLSASDAHIYKNQASTSITATFTPHHTGTVFATDIPASTSNANIVSISGNATKFPAANSNTATLNIIGKGPGIATLTASYTTEKLGIEGSVTCSVTCSELPYSTTCYTYDGGTGTISCSYDASSIDTSNSAVMTFTEQTTAINTSNKITYTGNGSGSATITMKSNAKIVVYCSNLTATTTRTIYSSATSYTQTDVPIENDAVSSYTGDTTDLSYTTSTSAVTVTARTGITANKTLTLNMRSGAKIVVNCYPATVGDTDVQLNVGDKKEITIGANDSVSSGGSTNYYTASKSGDKLTITAKAAGSDTITLASGLKITVTVKNITVTVS